MSFRVKVHRPGLKDMRAAARVAAKGVSEALVSLRLQYAQWPKSVLKFFTNGDANEGHARELRQILQCKDSSGWLTWEGAALEVIEAALRKAGADDIEIRVVHWRDEGEQGEPVASSMGRRVDYRAGLHWLAPVEHQPPAERVIVLSWGE